MDINEIMKELIDENKKTEDPVYKAAYLDGVLDFFNKMKEQMRTVIEAAAKGNGYRLRILTAEPNTKRISGVKVWITTYFILYTDD